MTEREQLDRISRLLADVRAMDPRKRRAVNVLELVAQLEAILARDE